jgi:hypothetical protein
MSLTMNSSVLAVNKVGTVTVIGSAWLNGSLSLSSFGVGVMGCPGLLT